MPQSPEDKRQFLRLNVLVDVTYKKKDFAGKEKLSLSKNISEGGICLIVYEPINEADVLELQIFLPDTKKPINVLGRVAWIKNFSIGDTVAGQRSDVGIEFLKIAKKDRKEIEKYVFTNRELKP
jgi:c-di-GMP-binding flagellar brake protein YcgR